jgi:hypothetical protein
MRSEQSGFMVSLLNKLDSIDAVCLFKYPCRLIKLKSTINIDKKIK